MVLENLYEKVGQPPKGVPTHRLRTPSLSSSILGHGAWYPGVNNLMGGTYSRKRGAELRVLSYFYFMLVKRLVRVISDGLSLAASPGYAFPKYLRCTYYSIHGLIHMGSGTQPCVRFCIYNVI